jgi:hypothetical protein
MTKGNNMTTAWSHLPNAHHIDRILADLTVNPGDWHWAWYWVSNRADYTARDAARDAAWDRAWDAARDAARDAALDVVYSAARDVARSAASSTAWAAASSAAWAAAWDAAWSAILALIAWPEASDYLNLSVDSVRVLAALGDHKAVLILSAAIAFESQKAAVVQMIDN